MAKASEHPAQVPTAELSGLIKDSARKAFGKQAAAAAHVGQAESNFSRDCEVVAAKLEKLGPEFLARLGEGLIEQYAPLSTPQQRAKQQIKMARAALDELEQAVELIA